MAWQGQASTCAGYHQPQQWQGQVSLKQLCSSSLCLIIADWLPPVHISCYGPPAVAGASDFEAAVQLLDVSAYGKVDATWSSAVRYSPPAATPGSWLHAAVTVVLGVCHCNSVQRHYVCDGWPNYPPLPCAYLCASACAAIDSMHVHCVLIRCNTRMPAGQPSCSSSRWRQCWRMLQACP
jgi:hypothetical protein